MYMRFMEAISMVCEIDGPSPYFLFTFCRADLSFIQLDLEVEI
jgi:hypothetical protein